MSDFTDRYFGGEVMLRAVRWYYRYPISYRDLETMMTGRGVIIGLSTIYHWVRLRAGNGETSVLAAAPATIAVLAYR